MCTYYAFPFFCYRSNVFQSGLDSHPSRDAAESSLLAGWRPTRLLPPTAGGSASWIDKTLLHFIPFHLQTYSLHCLVCLFVSCMWCGNNLTEGFPLPHSLPKVLTSSEMHGVLPGSGPASPSSLLQIFPGLAALCLLWLVGLIAYHLLLGIPTAAYKLNGQASSQDHTAFMRWHQSLLKVRGLSHPITTFTFSTSRWGLTAIL